MEEIKEADILIGIPSYNNVGTIGHVVRAVTAGLAKYFPGAKAVLFNSDGGSTDGTQEEVEKVQIEDFKTILTSHPVHPVHKIITPYHGVPGKGSAFRAIFEANFFGWQELTRLAIPIMRAQGRGRIVQCSSILGFVALRMRSPYIATKFALEGV